MLETIIKCSCRPNEGYQVHREENSFVVEQVDQIQGSRSRSKGGNAVGSGSQSRPVPVNL